MQQRPTSATVLRSENSLAPRSVNSAYIAGNLYNGVVRSLTFLTILAQVGQ